MSRLFDGGANKQIKKYTRHNIRSVSSRTREKERNTHLHFSWIFSIFFSVCDNNSKSWEHCNRKISKSLTIFTFCLCTLFTLYLNDFIKQKTKKKRNGEKNIKYKRWSNRKGIGRSKMRFNQYANFQENVAEKILNLQPDLFALDPLKCKCRFAFEMVFLSSLIIQPHTKATPNSMSVPTWRKWKRKRQSKTIQRKSIKT